MAISLEELLLKIPDDTEERVDHTRTQINIEVREAIKRETGLVLNRKVTDQNRTNISVPVMLVPGIPEVLKRVIYDDIQGPLLMISPFRRHLEMASDSLGNIEPLVKILKSDGVCKNLPKDNGGHVESTSSFIDELLELFEDNENDKDKGGDPVKRILGINEDVLGVYIYSSGRNSVQKGKIELYWGVIGLVAAMLGIEVEPLTAVVFIHEIAHAYTHLGADIDGNRWDNCNFANGDVFLIEGLAQYYTSKICEQIDNKYPGTLEAFTALLKHQPAAYQLHDEMTKNIKAEEIRFALLEVRRKGRRTLNDFFSSLKEAQDIFRKYS